MELQIITIALLDEYLSAIPDDLQEKFYALKDAEISTDTFSFYTSVASVFSSKIEGEPIELDSYIKHKKFGIAFLPDYTKKIDDLYNAYTFAKTNPLNKPNISKAHKLLSKHIVAKHQQGKLRIQNMYVTTPDGRIEYIAGLPIDEKVNGYGLNFVGRNFAKAKYAPKTEKELSLNTVLSKDIDTTQNLVLKGDNLDSLKILKNHYSNKIKCIYIDPPYNTTSDEFVYPDKFDKEDTEVLGFQNLSESDFQRMDFSFKTQKSHNGWLAFMYPPSYLQEIC